MIVRLQKWKSWQKIAATVAGVMFTVGLRVFLGDMMTVAGVMIQPAILLPALAWGWRYGLFANTLAVLGIWFFVFPPTYSFHLPNFHTAGNLIGIFAVGLFATWVSNLAHDLALRLRRNAAREKEQADLVIRELNHRLRNMLTVVRSIISQTLSKSPDIDHARRHLTKQVETLIIAYDLCVKDGTPSVCKLLEIQAEARGLKERLSLSGQHINADPQAAVTLALVFHELATNAIKYGAWSNNEGKVACSVELRGLDVEIYWRERGGPLLQEQITHTGFGSYLIPRALSALHGICETVPELVGYECRIRIPLESLQPSLRY